MSFNADRLSHVFDEQEITALIKTAIEGVTKNPLFLEADTKSTAQKIVNLITEVDRLLLEKGSTPERQAIDHPDPPENW